MTPPDIGWMARALKLAERGLYTTDPNPRVGCVLVRNGTLVGEGWHRKAGEAHAERLAIAAAGEAARGASAYVTLEPCCHQGRTPPCVGGILQAGVRRVVMAMLDPNPQVAGQGLAQLQAAGVEVSSGLLESEALALNPGFVRRMQTGRPYVRCKLAMSIDGRTAMASGESRWISSAAARRDVQHLRARSSAIVTGIETILADDPSMNVRLEPEALGGSIAAGNLRQPLRVILDSRLRMPARARMLHLPGTTLLYSTSTVAERQEELTKAGAQLMRLAGPGRVDLEQVLEDLGRREVNEVLVEAGPTLAGAFLEQGLIDEIWLYVAAHAMGNGARGLFELPGVRAMNERIALRFEDVRRVGPDLRVMLRPAA